MADKGDRSRARVGRELREALDDDFKAILADPSNEILRRVREGTLTRAKAEEWARLQGQPPFTSKPAPETFDPRGKRYWTLAQMTAWVIWRTDDAVRDVSEEYVSRCIEWSEVGPSRVRPFHHDQPEDAFAACGAGHELDTPKVRTANDVLTSALAWVALKCSPASYLEPGQAEWEIRDALQAGDQLKARHGEGEIIDPYLWNDLSPFHDGDGPHDAVFYPSGKLVRFHRVRVEQDSVIKLWPESDKKNALQGELTSDHAIVRTGLPGRPGSSHFVKIEFEARILRGETLPVLIDEARALERWLELNYPQAARCRAPSIANEIRKRYAELFPKDRRSKKKKRTT